MAGEGALCAPPEESGALESAEITAVRCKIQRRCPVHVYLQLSLPER